MDMMTVAPAPAAAPEPSSGRPAEGEGGAQPFEQALKQELAKPESGKTEPARPGATADPAAKAAAAAHSKAPAATPEWAVLLAGANDTDSVSDDPLAEAAFPAAEAEAALDTLIGSDAAATPLHPLLAPAAPVRTADTGLAPEKRGAAKASDAALKGGAFDARAAHAAEEAELQGRGAQSDASAFESLLAPFGTERAAATEAPASTTHAPALNTLASATFAPRWAAGQAALAEGAAVQTSASARIDTPLGASGWGAAFQQKIVWLVDRQQQSAELHMNPPHLGPVEVTLSLAEDGAHIAFTSPHAAVREAIEASLADLKTALGEKGLALGQATVGADSQAAREQREAEARAGGAGTGRGAGDAPVDIPLPARVVQRGLVDIFA